MYLNLFDLSYKTVICESTALLAARTMHSYVHGQTCSFQLGLLSATLIISDYYLDVIYFSNRTKYPPQISSF